MRAGDKLYWANGTQFAFSTFNGSTVGAPWLIGYNDWFDPSTMTGAFFFNGRMFYTKAGSNLLFYRYMEPDGYIVGATEFSLATQNISWSQVRGMAYVAGRIVYGGTDGILRSVAFDPTVDGGFAVDGASATVLSTPANGLAWSKEMLFYATQ
jgi:hypothetical protein